MENALDPGLIFTREARAAEIEMSVRQCRRGNPVPLIEICWGRVVTAAEVLADRSLIPRLKSAGIRFLVLDDFQLDLIRSIHDPSLSQIFVKGNTGCGKGAATAIGVCLYYAIWPDAKVVVTRDSFRRAKAVMYGEIKKWWLRMSWHPPGIDPQANRLKDVGAEEHVLEVVNPGSEEGFRGTHSPHVLFLFDEATAEVLEARFGLAYTQAKKLLALANPSTVTGQFRDAFRGTDDPDETQTINCPYGLRRLITVSGADMLNVRAECLEKPLSPPGGIEINGTHYPAGEVIPEEVHAHRLPIVPGQTCYDEFQGHLLHPDDRWINVYALGKFPSEDADTQLILRSWLTRRGGPHDFWRRYQQLHHRLSRRLPSRRTHSRNRLRQIFPVQALGLDVGASLGGDPSILTIGGRLGIYLQHLIRVADAIDLADQIEEVLLREFELSLRSSAVPLALDADGVGWGLGGIFRKRGIRVIECKGNSTSEVDPRRYVNLRTEAFAEFGSRLNPLGPFRDIPFMVPADPGLEEEFYAHHKIYGQDGIRFGVTPKRKQRSDKPARHISVEERIGRSPDKADSAVLFYRALQHVGLSLEDALRADIL